MELKFFKCERCGETLAGKTEKKNLQCGVFVGFKIDETPLACGGTMNEFTEEEVMEAAYRRRDKNV